MANGKLEPTRVNTAAVLVLAEWSKQIQSRKFSTKSLTPLMQELASALKEEQDKPQLIELPPKAVIHV